MDELLSTRPLTRYRFLPSAGTLSLATTAFTVTVRPRQLCVVMYDLSLLTLSVDKCIQKPRSTRPGCSAGVFLALPSSERGLWDVTAPSLLPILTDNKKSFLGQRRSTIMGTYGVSGGIHGDGHRPHPGRWPVVAGVWRAVEMMLASWVDHQPHS